MQIGYARSSTRDHNQQLQINALAAAGCERIFIEKAFGSRRDRPELKAALDSLHAGDALVVWKLDRLAQSVNQLAETAEHLSARQIDLKVLSPAIDTSGPGGSLVLRVFGAIEEFEHELKLERARTGRASARRRGGRPRALDDAQIRRAKSLLGDPKFTVDEIAQQLGTTTSTLYRHIPGGRSALADPIVA